MGSGDRLILYQRLNDINSVVDSYIAERIGVLGNTVVDAIALGVR